MHKLLLPVAALVAALPVAAQGDHFTSSPQGYEGVEGNTSVDLIGKEALLRFQQIDAFTLGGKSNRNRLYFRRDGLMPANAAYGSRNVMMEISFGESDLGSASANFDANYVAGTKTTVFTQKSYNFVDWTVNPATPPQAEAQAAVVFFDNLYSYAGKSASGNDWAWEVRVWSNDQSGNSYPMDADSVIPTVVTGTGATHASGCFGNSHTNIHNYGTKFGMDLDISGAAPMAPCAMILGDTPIQIQVPGWCGPFETNFLAIVNMPNTDVTGFSALNIDPIPYNAGLIGLDIYGQPIVIDAGAPGGLNIGRTRKATIPGDPPSGAQALHHWALDPDASSSTSGLQSGGIIIHTNHT